MKKIVSRTETVAADESVHVVLKFVVVSTRDESGTDYEVGDHCYFLREGGLVERIDESTYEVQATGETLRVRPDTATPRVRGRAGKTMLSVAGVPRAAKRVQRPASTSVPVQHPGELHPTTPDGRYFVVRGRLWRKSNPHLSADQKQFLVSRLMDARRGLRGVVDADARKALKLVIAWTKVQLGERGEAWWDDGAPDYNRKMVKNTPYADWFLQLDAGLTLRRRIDPKTQAPDCEPAVSHATTSGTTLQGPASWVVGFTSESTSHESDG